MDVFDAPLIIVVGYNGPAPLSTAGTPALTIEFGGIVLYYS